MRWPDNQRDKLEEQQWPGTFAAASARSHFDGATHSKKVTAIPNLHPRIVFGDHFRLLRPGADELDVAPSVNSLSWLYCRRIYFRTF